MSPVELVTVGGANGDLYQALQTLPARSTRRKWSSAGARRK